MEMEERPVTMTLNSTGLHVNCIAHYYNDGTKMVSCDVLFDFVDVFV